MENIIKEFKGDNAFLSNFFPTEVEFEGMIFPSSEAAFQAAKTKNINKRKPFQFMFPGEAKKQSRLLSIRDDWEEIKIDVMTTIVTDKFNRNITLKNKLIATGDALLIEGNGWKDFFWGVDLTSGFGKNWLGLILMKVRDKLKEDNVF